MSFVPALVVIGGLFAMRAAFHRARWPDVMARLAGREPQSIGDLWRTPPAAITRRAHDVALPIPLVDAWRWWRIAALVVAAGGWWIAGPVLAALGAVGACAAPVAALSVLRGRAVAAYDNDLVVALDAIGRGVRSGGSLGNAISEASAAVRGQVEADIRQVGADVGRGLTLVGALDAWSARRPRESVSLAVGALALAADTGGPPARVIEEIAGALRQRLQIEAEARAMGAQARLSAIVVGLAPIGFALLTSATDQRNAHMLFGTPLGLICVVTGLALDAAGAVWMHRISESVIA